MSLTAYAKKRAKETGRLLVRSTSHVQRRRLERLFGELEWFAPVALGSKTGLYFVPDTPDNRAKLAGISKPKVETPLS